MPVGAETFSDHLYGHKLSVLMDKKNLEYVMTTAKLDANGQ